MRKVVNRARAYLEADGLGPLLVRAVAGAGAVQIGAMLASFLVGVQLARELGVRGYGYYGVALAIVTTAGIPGEMGLPKLVTREVAAAEAKHERGLLFAILRWARRASSVLSFTVGLAIVAAAVALGSRLEAPLRWALVVGAPAIPFLALARVDGGAMQGLGYIVRGQVPANLLKPVAVSALLFGAYAAGVNLQPWGAMAAHTITAALAWIVAWSWLRARLPAASLVVPTGQGRRWLSSMIPLALTDGMFALQGQVSILVLAVLASPSDVGLFRIAVATAVILSAPQTIIVGVGLPLISRLHAQGQRFRLQKLLTRSAQFQLAGVLLLAAPLMIAPKMLLSAVYGPSYANAAPALQIILIGQIICAAFGPNGSLLNMTGHERRVTRALLVALVLNAGAIAVLVPRLHLVGGAAGYTISMLTWNIITWLDGRRLLGLDSSIMPAHLRAQARRADSR